MTRRSTVTTMTNLTESLVKIQSIAMTRRSIVYWMNVHIDL
jgi:hypothetical protein